VRNGSGAIDSRTAQTRKVRLEIASEAKTTTCHCGPAVAVSRKRTFARLGRIATAQGRLRVLPQSTEALIHIAMIRLMLRRVEPL
jgi:hypothetical protein